MQIYDRIIKNENKLFLSIRKAFDKHPLTKFISVLVLIIVYFLFVSKSHGIQDGFVISTLTWSFFVFCTPIADAGILIDFPMRLITGIKMIYSEIIVWVIAMSLNLFMFVNNPDIYNKTALLSLFKHIIDTPLPYWAIIILSGAGTFLSIHMADSLINIKKSKKEYSNFSMKYKTVIFISLVVLIVILYDFLLNKLGVQIALI